MNYDVVRARKTNRVGRVGRYDESREGRETGSPPGKYGEETAKSVRNDTRLHRARGKNASLNERSTPDDEERANRDEWISRTGISRSRMSESTRGICAKNRLRSLYTRICTATPDGESLRITPLRSFAISKPTAIVCQLAFHFSFPRRPFVSETQRVSEEFLESRAFVSNRIPYTSHISALAVR